MEEFKFENGIEVYESEHNYDLHCFKVFNGADYLGTIYPDNIEDMNNCLKSLKDGEDPITGGWEDGLGNLCLIEGWGEKCPENQI